MKLKQCLCVFLSLLFAVSLAGCREKTDPIYEQTIQYNLESEPSSLDPQIADDQSGKPSQGSRSGGSITETTPPLPFIFARTPAGPTRMKPR